MTRKYVLNGKIPVPVDDLHIWAKWFEEDNRHVALDEKGDIKVSTVFLGLDHSFGDEIPLLFETMIFGGPHDNFQERYTTWDEAEAGHKKAYLLAFGEEKV